MIPDFVMMLMRHQLPILAPLSTLLFCFGFISMFQGLARIQATKEPLKFSSWLKITRQTIRGIIYMLHWQIVMASITVRMSVRPKKLKWVKTVHEGAGNESYEF